MTEPTSRILAAIYANVLNAPITVRQGANVQSAVSTTPSVVLADAPNPGNLMIATAANGYRYGGTITVGLPAGFTILGNYSGSGTGQAAAVGYRIAASGDGTTWQFAQSQPDGWGSGNNEFTVVELVGNRSIVAAGAGSAGTIPGYSAATVSTPVVTSARPVLSIVAFFDNNYGYIDTWSPAGFTVPSWSTLLGGNSGPVGDWTNSTTSLSGAISATFHNTYGGTDQIGYVFIVIC
jgi:hypothetical protein